jgi:hypothetical protein
MSTLDRFYLRMLVIISLPLIFISVPCIHAQKDFSAEVFNGNDTILVDPSFTIKERLGKLLFFDENLSTPPGQSCAFCHDPKIAFADPELDLPVSRGFPTLLLCRLCILMKRRICGLEGYSGMGVQTLYLNRHRDRP